MKYHSDRLSILGSLHVCRNPTPHGHWKWLDIRNCKGHKIKKRKTHGPKEKNKVQFYLKDQHICPQWLQQQHLSTSYWADTAQQSFRQNNFAMSENTGKDQIYYPHAIITFISCHINTSLLLNFVLPSEHSMQYITLAVICCFSVPFQSGRVTSLCSFRCHCFANASMTPTADSERIRDAIAFLFMSMWWCKDESNTFRATVCQRGRGHVIVHFFIGTLLLAFSDSLMRKGLALFRQV